MLLHVHSLPSFANTRSNNFEYLRNTADKVIQSPMTTLYTNWRLRDRFGLGLQDMQQKVLGLVV